MRWKDRIRIDPTILTGKPAIVGTRISVEFVIGLLAIGWSEREIVDNHDVTPEDIRDCLEYAYDV